MKTSNQILKPKKRKISLGPNILGPACLPPHVRPPHFYMGPGLAPSPTDIGQGSISYWVFYDIGVVIFDKTFSDDYYRHIKTI